LGLRLPGTGQPGLEILELAGLGVDQALGLVIAELPNLVDEAGDPSEVEAGQASQQGLAVEPRPLEREQGVVEAADPQLGGKGERLRNVGGEGEDALQLLAAQDPLPDRALRQAGGLERIDQLWMSSSDWTQMCMTNIANMAWFSSDRAISEYAQEIWNVPVTPTADTNIAARSSNTTTLLNWLARIRHADAIGGARSALRPY
jgi:hypothetical protein